MVNGTPQSIPPFDLFVKQLNPKTPSIRQTLICLDPGETTGVAVFQKGKLVHAGQLITKDLISGSTIVNQYFSSYIPDVDDLEANPELSSDNDLQPRDDVHIIIEDYRVYGWKTDSHSWAELHTPKLIGAIVCLCVLYGVEHSMQMAHQAKQFVTDDKLERWGLYKTGMKHARDAIRHGAYYMLFDQSHMQNQTRQ